MKRLSFALLASLAGIVLLGSRCSPAPVTPVTPPGALPELNQPNTSQGESFDVLGVKFVSYLNKAQGYSISRPANWYWRHYIANEIKNINPAALDYFITDSKPLPGLGSEYLGKIVIEVSARPLSDYQAGVVGFAVTAKQVGGEAAKRYAGKRVNSAGEETAVVEYQFVRQGKTYRIILTGASGADQAIFEQIIGSFKFD